MNKKGFTLTEVLATLVILGVLLAIAIPSVSKLQEKFKKDYYKELEGTVLASAKTYFKDNAESRPVNILEASIIKYSELTTNKYIDQIKEYNSDNDIDGYVVIVKLKDDYIYKNCYKINSIEQYNTVDYLDSSGEENHEDNICYFNNDSDKITNEYLSLNTDEIYIHVNNYSNDELRDLLGAKKQIIRKNSSNEILYIENLDEETIYPNNMTALGISEASADTKITVTYKKSSSESITKDIVMFQHPAPLVNNSTNKEILIKKGEMVNISMPASPDTFSSVYNSSWKRYEYSVDGGFSWKELGGCESKNCSVDPSVFNNKEVNFRVVGKTSITRSDGTIVEKEQTGKQSDSYTIKIKMVTVTLNANGGSVTPTKLTDVEVGGNYPALPTPIRSGYEFLGWKYGSEEIKSGDKIVVESDHTLVASWKNTAYLIHYNSNGGSGSMASTSCNVGVSCILRDNAFTKEGYSFVGWAYSSSGVRQHSNSATVNFGSETTLYALWEANTYTVTLNPNGGTLSASKTFKVTYDDLYGDLPEPERNGYTFDGWYTKSSGGSKIYKFTKVKTSSNHTLYAHWSINKINLQVSTSSGTLDSSSILYSSSGGYVRYALSKTIETYDYNTNINLPNYNVSNKINIVRSGRVAIDGAEWKLDDGTTFDQDATINSSSLCDATKSDCTATIYVNWAPLPELDLIMTDASRQGTFYSEYVSNTSLYAEDLKYGRVYFNAFVKKNGNTINKLEYNLNNTGWKDFSMYEDCEDEGYRVCYNVDSSEYERGWLTFNNVDTYNYQVRVTYNNSYTLTDSFKIIISEKPSINLTLFATDASKDSSSKYKAYDSSWTKNNIYFNAFLTTNSNTIKSIKYSTDNGTSWKDFSNSTTACDSTYPTCSQITVNRRDWVVFNTTLNSTVRVRVVDQDDRIIEKSMLVRIDKDNPNIPTINLSSTTETSNDVTFTITNGNDSHSGVARSQYSYDNNNWSNYSSRVNLLSTTGTKTVYARTIDKVGNVSSSVNVTGKCDKDKVSVDRNSNGKTNGTCWFKLNLSQAFSGLTGINGYDYVYWNVKSTNDTSNLSEDDSDCSVSNTDLNSGNVTGLISRGSGTSSPVQLTQKYSKQYYCFAVRPHRNSEISGLNRWTIQKKHAITSNTCS